jgi:hypothetical protein
MRGRKRRLLLSPLGENLQSSVDLLSTRSDEEFTCFKQRNRIVRELNPQERNYWNEKDVILVFRSKPLSSKHEKDTESSITTNRPRSAFTPSFQMDSVQR